MNEKIYCSCGKVCYTERAAGRIININKKHKKFKRYEKKKKEYSWKVPKRKYYCNDCGYWHITSLSYFKGGDK